MQADAGGSSEPGLLSPGSFLRDRWEILSKIGGGGFGEIYKAKDHTTDVNCAVKVESCTSNKQVLKMEVAVLKRLQSSGTHTCQFLGCGRNSKVNYLVMSLLGPNLSELRKRQPNQKFSISTTLRVVMQIVTAIQAMHDCGFLHRDIKPSNFAVGDTPETSRTCYMLDYGLARQYTTVTGEVRQPRTVAGFRGTVRYASINAHLSRDLGRHDDLWSVFYLLVELAIGHLPWRKVKDKEEAGEFKSKYDHKKLLRGLPVELNDFLDHLRCSSYFDKPDYARVLKAFQDAMNRLGVQESDPYDWEQDFSAPSVTTASIISPPAVKLANEKATGAPFPTRTQPEPSRTNCSGVADLSEGRSEQREADARGLLKVPKRGKSKSSSETTPPEEEASKPSGAVMSSKQQQQHRGALDQRLKENLNIVNKYVSDEDDLYRDAFSSELQQQQQEVQQQQQPAAVSHTSMGSNQKSSLNPVGVSVDNVTPAKSYQTESLNRFFDMEPHAIKENYRIMGQSEISEVEDDDAEEHVSSQYFSKRFYDSRSDLNNAVVYPEGAPVIPNFFDSLQERTNQPPECPDVKLTCEEEEWSSPPEKAVDSNSKERTREYSLPSFDRTQDSKHDKVSSRDNNLKRKSRSRETAESSNLQEDTNDANSSHHSASELRKLVVCQLLVKSNTSQSSESSRSIEMLFAQKTQNTDFTSQPASDQNKGAASGSQNLASGNLVSGSTKLDMPDVASGSQNHVSGSTKLDLLDEQKSSQLENSSAVQLIPTDSNMMVDNAVESSTDLEEREEYHDPNVHGTLSDFAVHKSLAFRGRSEDHSPSDQKPSTATRQTKSASNFLEVSPKTIKILPRPPPDPPPLNYSVSLLARRRRFVRSKSKSQQVPKKS